MLAPNCSIIANVDKLGIDINPVPSCYDSAGDDCGDTQIPTDLLYINVLPFVAENRLARLHLELRQMSEAADQRFSHPIAQVIGCGVASGVGKGENGN